MPEIRVPTALSGTDTYHNAHAVTLHGDVFDVIVLPTKGADLYAIFDRATGIDLLFKTPWGCRIGGLPPGTGDSHLDWLARYPGGWQLLIPNAGSARNVDGVQRGYHGEAALLPWRITDLNSSSIALAVDLLTAPLRLRRQISVAGSGLTVTDTVINDCPDPVEFMWVQHPAFSAPFLDEHARIDCGARTLITDADTPGTALPANTAFAFPAARDRSGGAVDLREVPAPDAGRSVFAALTDFDGGWFSITSPTAGFGVRLDWDPEVYPHAWFWQECRASSGFPWFRRAYTIAIEPANVLPGDGRIGHRQRGRSAPLRGGGTQSTQLHLTRIP